MTQFRVFKGITDYIFDLFSSKDKEAPYTKGISEIPTPQRGKGALYRKKQKRDTNICHVSKGQV